MNRKVSISANLVIVCGMIFTSCSSPGDIPDPQPANSALSTAAVSTPPVEESEPTDTEQPAAAPNPSSANQILSIIYDDDGSRDGTAALLYLLSEPHISLKAVNISYGEAHPEIYIQHIGRLLEAVGASGIPLGAGQDAPIGNGTPFPDWLRHMSDEFWYYPLPYLENNYPVDFAPELMVSTINESPEPITIFMSGTFTSLAQALQLDPEIGDRIDAVYSMGGAVHVPGNITNLIPESENEVAEWNIISDPQAASEVLESGLEIYLVPLDSTNQVLFEQDDIQPWHAGNQKARYSAELYDIMYDDYGFEEAEIFDLGAAVIMVHPYTCDFQPLHLDIITEGGENLGQTVVDPDENPNVYVCLDPDENLIKQILDETFSGSTTMEELPSVDPLVGTWEGTVINNGFEMQMSLTIIDTCRLNSNCGRFDISTAACSGSLTWIGMDGDMYQFEATDKTEACGTGNDYLVPQSDGTLKYVSRGDYGETTGTLIALE